MFKVTSYHWLKYHANKKILFGEVAKECHLACKQKQLSQTISIKIQLPLFWDQHSAVPLPVTLSVELDSTSFNDHRDLLDHYKLQP